MEKKLLLKLKDVNHFFVTFPYKLNSKCQDSLLSFHKCILFVEIDVTKLVLWNSIGSMKQY